MISYSKEMIRKMKMSTSLRPKKRKKQRKNMSQRKKNKKKRSNRKYLIVLS